MRSHRQQLFVALATAIGVAAQTGVAFAQQSQQRKPPPTPAQAQQSSKIFYDMYEPILRQRLRREACRRDELSAGAFCALACQKGYVHVAGSMPPRCRSLTPLPAGQLPGPVRKETAAPLRPPLPRSVPPTPPRTGPRPA